MEEYNMKNSALVVIDLQNDITKNYKEIIAKVNEAIDWAAQKEFPSFTSSVRTPLPASNPPATI